MCQICDDVWLAIWCGSRREKVFRTAETAAWFGHPVRPGQSLNSQALYNIYIYIYIQYFSITSLPHACRHTPTMHLCIPALIYLRQVSCWFVQFFPYILPPRSRGSSLEVFLHVRGFLPGVCITEHFDLQCSPQRHRSTLGRRSGAVSLMHIRVFPKMVVPQNGWWK